jgi:NADH dehydrogenase
VGEIRVLLIHSGDRILPEMSEELALFAQRILQKRGVELRLGSRLEAATGNEAVLKGGERLPTRTLVSTIPSSPHPLVDALELPKSKNGRLLVDAQLKVEGTDNIWSLGDGASIPTPDGGWCPPTAQHATRQAEVVAHNIGVALRGGKPKVFDFKGLGKMGSLGHRSAVAEVFGIKVSGFLAWWMWRTIYLMKLPGWGRRLKVATSWTLDVLLPPELVQLKLGGTRGIHREHFEPGQEIFHEGDLGDRIYIILSGRVEVVRREGDGPERRLAQLGAGESFGEMALLNEARRNATVRCTEAMDVLSLPKGDFTALTSNLPDLRASFEGVMEVRERALHDEEHPPH